jgi:hypothetical protein
MDDTQYLALTLTLEGHFIEPELYVERDIMADNGTYVNLKLGHTFELSEGLSICPSVAQGLGNTQRSTYFADEDFDFRHGGLMDTSLRVDFQWSINDWLTFGAYVAYYDYLFDRNMREAARYYNSGWGSGNNRSFHFVGGLSLKATF